MKRSKRLTTILAALCAASVPALSGCDDLILENVLLGVREGTLTTTNGIIEGFFQDGFGLEAEEAEHGDEDEHGHEESGNDLFIRP